MVTHLLIKSLVILLSLKLFFLIINFQNELVALFLEFVLLTELSVWDTSSEDVVEVKLVFVQKLYGVHVDVKIGVLVAEEVAVSDDGSRKN